MKAAKLFLVLSLSAFAWSVTAATFSTYPVTTTVASNDLVLVDQWGGAAYTTKIIRGSNLLAVANATNVYLQAGAGGTIKITTNGLSNWTLDWGNGSTGVVQAVANTLRTNNEPATINVRDFGALGNNGNDSVALKAAFMAWTNRGGTLYFPAGTYQDTNTYVISVAGASDASAWQPLEIRGQGQGVSKWNVNITNATFIWTTNIPISFYGIRATDVGSGTNHFLREQGSPQGNLVLAASTVAGFKGFGMDWGATDLGTAQLMRFDLCGVGMRIGGFGDGWNGSLVVTRCSVAGLIIGFTNSSSAGQKYAHGHNWYIEGNLNYRSVIIGPGYGNTFSGAFESPTNCIFAVGYPPDLPAFVDTTVNDSIGIGAVTIRNFNLLDNGVTNHLVALYAKPQQVRLGNVSASSSGTLVASRTASADTTPVICEGALAATNFLFSDASAVRGGFASNTFENMAINLNWWTFNKATNVVNISTNGIVYTSLQNLGVTNWILDLVNGFTYDTDAQNYFTRSGISDWPTKHAINSLVLAAKTPDANGWYWWTNCDGIWPMAGGTSNSTAINLKSNANHIVWSASGGTYSVNGVTGNGTSFFGETGLNLNTQTANYLQNSAFMFVYCGTTAPTDAGRFVGGSQFTSSTIRADLYPNVTALTADGPNASTLAGVSYDTSVDDFRGPMAVLRTSSTAVAIARGANYATASITSSGRPNATLGFLCRDTDQGQDHFSNAQLRGGAVGGGMTQAQWDKFRADWETFETALGRNAP